VPIQKAAFKALRKAHKRHQRNSRTKRRIQENIKEMLQTLETNNKTDEKLLKKTISLIDKAARKNILKKNTAARKKSRLMKRLNTKHT